MTAKPEVSTDGPPEIFQSFINVLPLFAHLEGAFDAACEANELNAAEDILNIFESLATRKIDGPERLEQIRCVANLVALHRRLWQLRRGAGIS